LLRSSQEEEQSSGFDKCLKDGSWEIYDSDGHIIRTDDWEDLVVAGESYYLDCEVFVNVEEEIPSPETVQGKVVEEALSETLDTLQFDLDIIDPKPRTEEVRLSPEIEEPGDEGVEEIVIESSVPVPVPDASEAVITSTWQRSQVVPSYERPIRASSLPRESLEKEPLRQAKPQPVIQTESTVKPLTVETTLSPSKLNPISQPWVPSFVPQSAPPIRSTVFFPPAVPLADIIVPAPKSKAVPIKAPKAFEPTLSENTVEKDEVSEPHLSDSVRYVKPGDINDLASRTNPRKNSLSLESAAAPPFVPSFALKQGHGNTDIGKSDVIPEQSSKSQDEVAPKVEIVSENKNGTSPISTSKADLTISAWSRPLKIDSTVPDVVTEDKLPPSDQSQAPRWNAPPAETSQAQGTGWDWPEEVDDPWAPKGPKVDKDDGWKPVQNSVTVEKWISKTVEPVTYGQLPSENNGDGSHIRRQSSVASQNNASRQNSPSNGENGRSNYHNNSSDSNFRGFQMPRGPKSLEQRIDLNPSPAPHSNTSNGKQPSISLKFVIYMNPHLELPCDFPPNPVTSEVCYRSFNSNTSLYKVIDNFKAQIYSNHQRDSKKTRKQPPPGFNKKFRLRELTLISDKQGQQFLAQGRLCNLSDLKDQTLADIGFSGVGGRTEYYVMLEFDK